MPTIKTFRNGTRVRLLRDAERYPHFIAPAGSTGVLEIDGERAGESDTAETLAEETARLRSPRDPRSSAGRDRPRPPRLPARRRRGLEQRGPLVSRPRLRRRRSGVSWSSSESSRRRRPEYAATLDRLAVLSRLSAEARREARREASETLREPALPDRLDRIAAAVREVVVNARQDVDPDEALDLVLGALSRSTGGRYNLLAAMFRLLDREEAGRGPSLAAYGTRTQDAILRRAAVGAVENPNGARARLAYLLDALQSHDRRVRLCVRDIDGLYVPITETRGEEHWRVRSFEVANRILAGRDDPRDLDPADLDGRV